MRAGWPVLATMLSIGTAYAAYPYVTLYRLGVAIRSSDTGALETLVDWPAVREGIKEDVCDLGPDNADAKKDDALPVFGASFRKGIAASKIDQVVTPRALLAATSASPSRGPSQGPRDVKPSEGQRAADVHIGWAFFDGPTTFMVDLRAPGQAEPIKLEMDLHDGEWRVQRVWLPRALLSNSGDKT